MTINENGQQGERRGLRPPLALPFDGDDCPYSADFAD
jgi:hypothetical protein